MLKIQSTEWKEFIQKLEIIKTKSNREVLCIHCWQMLNCKQKIKHLKKNPDHEKYLLTSTKYASEKQILSLAKAQNKYFSQPDGEYVATPYGPFNRQFRDQMPMLIREDIGNIGLVGNTNGLIQPLNIINQGLKTSPLQIGNISISGMQGLEATNALLKQPFFLQQNGIHLPEASVYDKIAMINQRLDSIVKVLQMLVQQDLLVNQNFQQLNQNIQNLTQISLNYRSQSQTSDVTNQFSTSGGSQIFQQNGNKICQTNVQKSPYTSQISQGLMKSVTNSSSSDLRKMSGLKGLLNPQEEQQSPGQQQSKHIEEAGLSALGGIQPSQIQQFTNGTVNSNFQTPYSQVKQSPQPFRPMQIQQIQNQLLPTMINVNQGFMVDAGGQSRPQFSQQIQIQHQSSTQSSHDSNVLGKLDQSSQGNLNQEMHHQNQGYLNFQQVQFQQN